QHLDGDGPIEQQVTREVHVGHATARDLPVQLVAVVENRRSPRSVRHARLSLNGGHCVSARVPASAARHHGRSSLHRHPPFFTRSAASSSRLTIGPAFWPPVASSLSPGWLSNTAATATCGSTGGPPKAIIQMCDSGGSVPNWAVPVLAPT